MRGPLVVLVLAALLGARPVAATVGAGDPLPSFALARWDGARVAAADVAGKVVVVDFWATWCATCKEALPAIDALARRLADRGVVVLAVNVDRNRKAADAWLAERLPAPQMTLLHDPEGSLLARLGAGGMPAVYVADRTGVVRFAASGYSADRLAELERTVEQLARPEPPPPGGD